MKTAKISDAELMELADGELSDARTQELEALLCSAAGAMPANKVAGLREVSELVRGHLELTAEQDEARLAARMDSMWREIDKQIDLQATPADAPPTKVATATGGSWFASFIGRFRGHILTGVVSAGAVAAIAMVVRPGTAPTESAGALAARGADRGAARGAEFSNPSAVEPGTRSITDSGEPNLAFVTAPSEQALPRVTPVVESVETTNGSSMVFTIEDDDGNTAVVWVTPDDTVEGL